MLIVPSDNVKRIDSTPRVEPIYYAMAIAQMHSEGRLMPDASAQQPDVSTEHPDFDRQLDRYFESKDLRAENKAVGKWKEPVDGPP